MYPRQLPAQTAPNYSTVNGQTNTAAPAPSEEPESPSHTVQTDSNFSMGDAAWVVMRTLSTVSECLHFVCRRVVVLSSVCLGGFAGLLQYAHENLGNRTVEKTPPEEHNRIAHQPPSQPGQPIQRAPSRQNPPMEEYVRESANKWKKAVESSTSPGSDYSWMQLAGMALSVTSSLVVLGTVGSIILHLPGMLLKAEPYITLDSPPCPQLPPQPASIPLNPQATKSGALDPAADGRHRNNPASQPPPTLFETQTTDVTSAGESSQETMNVQSTPVAENHVNRRSRQPVTASGQGCTSPSHATRTTIPQTAQQPNTSAPSPRRIQNRSIPKRHPDYLTRPTGQHFPTSVPVNRN